VSATPLTHSLTPPQPINRPTHRPTNPGTKQPATPLLLAGYEDGAVALWDARSPARPVASRRLHSEPVMALGLVPALPAAAAGEGQGGGGRRDAEAAAEEGPAEAAGVGPETAGPTQSVFHGISGSADASLVFFSATAATGSLAVTSTQQLPSAGVGDVAVRADGRVAATAHWDGRVRLWHARRRAPLGVLRYHSKAAAAVAFAGRGAMRLASGGRDGAVAVWDVFPLGGGGEGH
jgi:WD40 repeat protein